MAFRLIRYAVAAMQRHLEAGYKQLPLVITVLLYTDSRSPYPYSTRWLDEFEDPVLAEKDRLVPLLLAGYLSSSQVISLVHYILQAGKTSDVEAFVRELAQRVLQHGEGSVMMNPKLRRPVIVRNNVSGLRLTRE